MSGKSISELLKKGENYLESIKVEVAHKLTKCKCPVISADVEAIKRHSDMKELRENGVVIFIDNKSPLKLQNEII
jgi:shikimate kinase